MSKIVPKPIQSQASQDIKTNQHRNENTESDVMFSDLFGGAKGETSSEESLIGEMTMTTLMSPDSGEGNSSDEKTSDEWKSKNLEEITKRMKGWQLNTFQESYNHKINNGISLFKKKKLETK